MNHFVGIGRLVRDPYARHIKYCTDCKEYDLTTGEPV